jgi:ATP-dependent Lon protease
MTVNQAKILNNQGLTFYNNGDYDKALDNFDAALDIDSKYTEAYRNRGNVFLKKAENKNITDEDREKLYKEAEAAFKKVIEYDPGDAFAYDGLGQVDFLRGNYGAAAANYEMALTFRPNDEDFRKHLEDAYARKNEPQFSAKPFLSKHVSMYQWYKNTIAAFKFEGEIKETVEMELDKLDILSPTTAEFGITQNWLDWIVKLPWNDTPAKSYTLKDAARILDEDHYGLKDVKTRILEYLAVRKQKNDTRGAILCLAGPPGVGKTSVGKSIARAMNKAFFRFSVGGMHDEAELRGHRRTYIGAQPGQIIKGLKAQKTRSPVCLIDEVDKMEKDSYHGSGSPYSALLEVLDPEQNNTFRDNYIDLPFDLSNVFFILTANELLLIPEPVRDRMEIIEIPGYIDTEKLEIAKNYLIPKTLERCGLDKSRIRYSDEALLHIANGYAFEAGVRELERNLDKINRKAVKIVVEDAERNSDEEKQFAINSKADVEQYLGRPLYNYDKSSGDLIRADRPGMAVGLAVSGSIGKALLCETISTPGEKGFTLTGNLEKVIKESAKIALAYTRKLAIENFGVDQAWFENNHIHIHFPEGATPKDGPSAGITIAVALLSLFTNRTVEPDVAMTGELTLGGRVLAIGGLKEKIIGAKHNGVKHVIFPKQNIHDLEEVPDIVKEGIEFHPVERFEEILAGPPLALPGLRGKINA